ncbi:LysE family translocator [Aeromicrobium sp. NPDC092404]|uniref:LysE family translocator n=1 Tax=Aeromicrobium sp. NPDC092404 TaxID=3154976 RepID=UPI00341252DC
MGIHWWAFLGVVAVAYAIPGPDFAVILRSSTRGWRAGAAAALGAQTGLCVHMLVAAAGLSVLLARSPEALTTIRWAGAAYLVWLGIGLIRSSFKTDDEVRAEPDLTTATAFTQALLTNLLNPKAILFFAAVLPQFVVAGTSTAAQVLALGIVDVVAGLLLWAVLVSVGAGLGAWFARPTVRRRWDRATGGVLTGLGATLATTKL